MSKAYTCFCTAVIHKGHLNIISEARKLGEVIVGVLSDEAMIRYNRFPTCTFEDRLAAANVENHSLTNFDVIAEVAAKQGYIAPEDVQRLIAFRNNPSDESWIGGAK